VLARNTSGRIKPKRTVLLIARADKKDADRQRQKERELLDMQHKLYQAELRERGLE